MRKLVLVPVLALAVACGDSTPFTPEESVASDLILQVSGERASTAPVTALIVFSYPEDLGIETVTGKVLHSNGAVYVWDVSGGLSGTFTATGEWLYKRNGFGSGHGTWSMDLTDSCDGGFEGNWHGVINPLFSGRMVGQGTEGCSGKTLKADFAPFDDNDFVQWMVGTLHEPNG